MLHSKCPPIMRILSRINPIPRIDGDLFDIYCNIVLSFTLRPSYRSLEGLGLRFIILRALLSYILATFPVHFKSYHRHYIT